MKKPSRGFLLLNRRIMCLVCSSHFISSHFTLLQTILCHLVKFSNDLAQPSFKCACASAYSEVSSNTWSPKPSTLYNSSVVAATSERSASSAVLWSGCTDSMYAQTACMYRQHVSVSQLSWCATVCSQLTCLQHSLLCLHTSNSEVG